MYMALVGSRGRDISHQEILFLLQIHRLGQAETLMEGEAPPGRQEKRLGLEGG